MSNKKTILFFILLFLAVESFSGANAMDTPRRLLVPMGGGYSDVYGGFIQSILPNEKNGQINIAILPMAYSTNPLSISEGERQTNIKDAESRRFEVEEACKRAAPQGVTCSAILAPIFTRDDASDPAALNLLTESLSAAFILGGDQTVAMQVIIDSPLEARLAELYESGMILGGTSAGCGMQSFNMLGGYEQNFAAGNSLLFGAADVWNTPERHGLTFGIQQALIDQHFFQRSRFGRLLNAISLPNVPHIGIGVDAYTGMQILDNHTLGNVFGLYAVAILDAETYHAAEGVRYVSVADDQYLVSMRNVLVHLLAQGDFTYDLDTRQSSLGTYAPTLIRNFDSLRVPDTAGTLLLAGDLSKSLNDNPLLAKLIQLSGGEQARILIVSGGYPSQRSAQTNAETYQKALKNTPVEIIALEKNAETPIAIPENITGILLIGKDASLLIPSSIAPIKDAWLAGIPILADNAAASILGKYYANHGPTPDDAEQEELLTQKAFIQGIVDIKSGLGLLDVNIEPRLLQDNRWGRFFSVAYSHPDLLTVGLNDSTAIEVTAQEATASGSNVIFVLDLRTAQLALGSNRGYVIANGLLDVFGPGESISPEPADVDTKPESQPTPFLPSPTPAETNTPIPTATIAIQPSFTPKPIEAAESKNLFPPSLLIFGIFILIILVVAFQLIRKNK